MGNSLRCLPWRHEAGELDAARRPGDNVSTLKMTLSISQNRCSLSVGSSCAGTGPRVVGPLESPLATATTNVQGFPYATPLSITRVPSRLVLVDSVSPPSRGALLARTSTQRAGARKHRPFGSIQCAGCDLRGWGRVCIRGRRGGATDEIDGDVEPVVIVALKERKTTEVCRPGTCVTPVRRHPLHLMRHAHALLSGVSMPHQV